MLDFSIILFSLLIVGGGDGIVKQFSKQEIDLELDVKNSKQFGGVFVFSLFVLNSFVRVVGYFLYKEVGVYGINNFFQIVKFLRGRIEMKFRWEENLDR